MRTLFWKIFGWFFVSNALIVVLIVAVFAAMRSADERERPRRESFERRSFAPALAFIGQAAVMAYQRDGAAGATRLLRETERDFRGELFLFDAKGRFLAGSRPLPPESARLALLRELETQRFASFAEGNGRLVARRISADATRSFALVARLPERPPFGRDLRKRDGFLRFLLQPDQLPLRLAIYLLGAGLVCYGLAAYLTSPVRKLRLATQRLSAGDLGARVGSQIGKRRDELAELGRDFDAMAARIETLLGSQRRLLGDISHELRSPLARMQVALDLADGDANPETVPHLERIRRESERLNALIGQLLTITRLESGEVGLTCAPVDLRRVVEEIAADARFEAHRKNRSVETRLEEREIVGDVVLLRSAIENVVRNAVRYTREGTAVEIELSGDGETRIRVRDRGPGVPHEALGDLFRPFYRVEGARDRSSGGEGLGLAIAERAVRAHGGQIRAENHPDGGLEIEIRFPQK